MADIVTKIGYAMSLRKPQQEALGRVDRVCSRDGYVAIGEEHKRHNRTQELPASTLTPIRPFLPPELIIQDW